MERQVNSSCSEHPDRFSCPDALMYFSASRGEYGIIVHDGGTSWVAIAFCPWCGAFLGNVEAERA
jgi:hypothetical protein